MDTDQHGWVEQKRNLRGHIRTAVRSLSPAKREFYSSKACELLRQQPIWKHLQSVSLYAPLPEELDIWPLVDLALAESKVVVLPRFDPETNRYVVHQIRTLAGDILSGRFGIREPKPECPKFPLNRLDFILVPGVAFDRHGRRLGRGKGYYDQLLADVRGKTCGVAFDEQIVAEIPVEPHDVHLNCILTPTRWIEP